MKKAANGNRVIWMSDCERVIVTALNQLLVEELCEDGMGKDAWCPVEATEPHRDVILRRVLLSFAEKAL